MQNQTIKEMESIIAEKSKSEEAHQSTIDELQAKVNAYEEEKHQNENKKIRRALRKFVVSILLKVLCIVVPAIIVYVVSKHYGWDLVQVASMVLAILGIIPMGIGIFKKDVKNLRSIYRENQ